LALSLIPPVSDAPKHPQPPEFQTTAGFLSYHSSVVNVPLAHCFPACPTPPVFPADRRGQVLTLPPPRLPVKSASFCFHQLLQAFFTSRLQKPLSQTQLSLPDATPTGHKQLLYHSFHQTTNPVTAGIFHFDQSSIFYNRAIASSGNLLAEETSNPQADVYNTISCLV